MGRTGRRSNTTRNCLFLATSDEGLLRAAAIIDLWTQEFVEPVLAPPNPYHILAQQLMALILQESAVGVSQWFEWVASVPAFAEIPRERVEALVQFMVGQGILWNDEGLLSFAPEGEAIFGKKNFMDLLSVFTSPPLFRVMSGQKELGYVHESTFYKKDEGPAILVLAGRSWKTNHLDWNRRIAHVEPTDERGRSRWLGEGQMLSHEVCQSIRRLLASDEDDERWSERSCDQFQELRHGYPWADANSTSLVREPNGEIRWWTFAGGIANHLLGDELKRHFDTNVGNLSIRLPSTVTLEAIAEAIDQIEPETLRAIPSVEAIENLKFSECLPPEIAALVFVSRFDDKRAVEQLLSEPTRIIVSQ